VLLINLTVGDVLEPLKRFQSTTASDKDRVLKLILDMNTFAGSPVDVAKLKLQFDKCWPEFKAGLDSALAAHSAGGTEAVEQARDPTEQALG